jgi:flagellar protein FliO/FliZ
MNRLATIFCLLAMAMLNIAAGPSTGPTNWDAMPIGGGAAIDRAVATTQAAVSAGSFIDLGRVITALAIVLGTILVGRFVVRKLFPGSTASSAGRAVKVLSRNVIAPRQQVMLLQVGKRIIVVGDSAGQMNTLANIDDPDEVAELIGATQSVTTDLGGFKSLFGKRQDEYDPPPESKPEPTEPPLAVQSELSSLIEKVRSLKQQMKV